MLNQLTLVGRLINDPMIEEKNGIKMTKIILSVPRSFKNMNGEYDTDYIDCYLWNGLASHVVKEVKKQSIVCIKGRLQANRIEDEGKIKTSLDVIAEKVTFLSSKDH